MTQNSINKLHPDLGWTHTLFFDVETTGLPKNWKAPVSDLENWPRIVQLAWLEYDNKGNELSRNNYIVKPIGFTIPGEATKIHGITTEQAKKEGVIINDILKKFSSAIGKAKMLVSHNIEFDQNVVGAEFLRADISNSLFNIKKVCTMKESTDYCRIPSDYGFKWPSQSELHYKLFNTPYKDSHNALKDATVCAKCFFELIKRGVIFWDKK